MYYVLRLYVWRFASCDGRLDCLDDVADVVVGDVRSGREAEAYGEERLADTVDVCGRITVDRLFVHRLPERTRLDAGGVEGQAHRLHVGVGLAVGHGGGGGMGHAGGSSDGARYHLFICVLLPLYLQVRVERACAEPEVGVEYSVCRLMPGDVRIVCGGGIAVHRYSLHVLQQFAVELLHVPVVGDMVVDHRHLSAAYAGADVAHAVVVADVLVLVVWIALAGLCGVEEYLVPVLLIVAYQSSPTRRRDHLVAVEGKHAVFAERTEHLPVEARAESLGCVLDHGDAVSAGDLHDAVDSVGHAVEGHGDDGLRGPACLGDAVPDGLLEEVGVHVPGIRLGVYEDRCGAEVGDGV